MSPQHPDYPHLTLGRDIMQSPGTHHVEAEVDEEVWHFLKKRFEEGYDLNYILRRLLDMDDPPRKE